MTRLKEEILETVTIESATPDERQGRPIWDLKLKCSFTQYPIPTSIPREWGRDLEKDQRHNVRLRRGRQKEKGDGTHLYDYYWDIAEWDTEALDIVSPSAPDGETKTTAPPPSDGEGPPPLPQALGACQNHAMAFIQSGIIPVPEGRDPINFLWELRDRVYRNVNQRPFQPEHYCYSCERERVQSQTKKWGHRVEGGWCIENEGILADKP